MGQPQNSGLLIFKHPEAQRGIAIAIDTLKVDPPKGSFFY